MSDSEEDFLSADEGDEERSVKASPETSSKGTVPSEASKETVQSDASKEADPGDAVTKSEAACDVTDMTLLPPDIEGETKKSGDNVTMKSKEKKSPEEAKSNTNINSKSTDVAPSQETDNSKTTSPKREGKGAKSKNKSKGRSVKEPEVETVEDSQPLAESARVPGGVSDNNKASADSPMVTAVESREPSIDSAIDTEEVPAVQSTDEKSDSDLNTGKQSNPSADLVSQSDCSSEKDQSAAKEETGSAGELRDSAESPPETEMVETEQDTTAQKDVTTLFDKLSTGPQSIKRDSQEESVLEKLAQAGEKKQQQQSSGWGSWGSWGSSLLNTATSSLQTFTGQVSEGMHTVVETFEASVGAPPPHQLDEDLSQFVKEPNETDTVIPKDSSTADSSADGNAGATGEDEAAASSGSAIEKRADNADWFASWGVSGITDQLQSKTKVLLDSGLDVLETIGKKTMEQIKETDPGFTKTKGFLKGNQVNLSQVLREAKEENEKKAAEMTEVQPLTSYSSLFDQHQGIASLEALELLSVTCTNSLTDPDDLEDEIQEKFDSLTERFTQIYDSDEDDEEEHDFSSGAKDFIGKLSLPVKHARLVEAQQKARDWLTDCQQRQDAGERMEGHTIHNEALNSFAELTSATMELCHKSGELLLLSPEQEVVVDVDTVSDSFISILRLVNNEISQLSRLYNECLNTAADDSEDPDSINPMITNIFLEASNSSSYVRDAFKLLLPVLKKCLLPTT